MLSSAHIDKISQHLPEPLLNAIRSSRQWKEERTSKMERTGCMTIFVPDDPIVDVSIQLYVSQESGFTLGDQFDLVRTDVSEQKHPEP